MGPTISHLVRLGAAREMVERIRGRKLQEIRRQHFEAHPLCVRCIARGRVSPAVVLDHIVALTNGGEDVESNRQGLCLACHDEKTLEDLELKPKGCDINGLPTDPRHPWNAKT